MSALLEAKSLSISFGGIRAVEDVSLAAEAGRILAVIGPNGAGKTTLFNLISGVYAPHAGTVCLDGANVTGLAPHLFARRGLARTFQNLQIFFRMSALENVMVGRHRHEATNLFAQLLALPAGRRENRASEARARELLAFVGLSAVADEPAGALPYGALKRLEIARALATDPRVLLLDEPAAGCNPVETAEVDSVIKAIARTGIAIVLVEHDMALVMKISDRILVLNNGRRLAEGTAAEIRGDPAVIAAYLGAERAKSAAGGP